MMTRSVIVSCGSYLPQKIVTNAELAERVDTNDEWITQRTGIRQRHVAAEKETSADMAIAAGRQALKNGNLSGTDIDAVIICTCTPDQTFPSVAIKVQAALDIPPGPAFDVQAVCAGFVYGLSVADSFIRGGTARRILLIGAEKMTSLLDWNDRTTCVLFGDGAGAIILEAAEDGERGIMSTHLYANGKLKDILYTSGGTSSTADAGFIVMEGKEVFRHAVQYMADVVVEALEHNNVKPEQVDWLVPHQANIRIIEGTAKKLGMGMDRVVVTIDRHGNTSAASIPLALCEAVTDGRIKKGDLVLMEALGAGLTWGAAMVRF
jgi:3-oxoacyl-[acyl-carrier-protein] synthase-3